MILRLSKSVWDFRGFIRGSVQREFQARYRNSLLGAAWTLLNPLAMIVVYTVIFSQLMRARLPGVDDTLAYSIYLCTGVLTWGLFSEIASRSLNIFIDNANLLKKLNFPRICLPIIVILSALINFSIIFGLFLTFLLITDRLPGIVLVALPFLVGLQVIFAASLGMALGILNVFFRDVGQFFGVVLQFWFWLTPVVYPLSVVPENIARWISYNPLTPLINSYQQLILTGAWPDLTSLLPLIASSIAILAISISLFRKRSGEMVDEL